MLTQRSGYVFTGQVQAADTQRLRGQATMLVTLLLPGRTSDGALTGYVPSCFPGTQCPVEGLHFLSPHTSVCSPVEGESVCAPVQLPGLDGAQGARRPASPHTCSLGEAVQRGGKRSLPPRSVYWYNTKSCQPTQ